MLRYSKSGLSSKCQRLLCTYMYKNVLWTVCDTMLGGTLKSTRGLLKTYKIIRTFSDKSQLGLNRMHAIKNCTKREKIPSSEMKMDSNRCSKGLCSLVSSCHRGLLLLLQRPSLWLGWDALFRSIKVILISRKKAQIWKSGAGQAEHWSMKRDRENKVNVHRWDGYVAGWLWWWEWATGDGKHDWLGRNLVNLENEATSCR
jgi:hypothetical protein